MPVNDRPEESGRRGDDGPRLISEPIEPMTETFDPGAMSRGEPGLPSGFVWRGVSYRIGSCEKSWNVNRPDSTGTEMYRRRHYFALTMADGARWVVYLLRQPPPGRAGRIQTRWFLYTVS